MTALPSKIFTALAAAATSIALSGAIATNASAYPTGPIKGAYLSAFPTGPVKGADASADPPGAAKGAYASGFPTGPI